MTTVTLSIAQALHRLTAPEMAPIVEYLKAERLEALEQMAAVGEEWQWRKAQGRAQFAEQLLKLVADAPTLVAKLNASR
jgi:hypothetical protein